MLTTVSVRCIDEVGNMGSEAVLNVTNEADDDHLQAGVLVPARGSKVNGRTQHYEYVHVEKSPSIWFKIMEPKHLLNS